MPSISLFQGTQLDDRDAIDSWLLAHRMRHIIYAQSAALQGTSADAQAYLGFYPDEDWHLRHANVHQTLQAFYMPTQSNSLTILTQVPWDNQTDFDAWMQMHTNIHALIDQAFGVVGS